MSSFGGLMVEYQQIAIDRFQGPAVLRARAYFLSHAHADHMVGLDSQQFSKRLNSSTHIKLYCSEVTREFLLTDRRFVHLEPFLISLPIEEPTLITLCDDTKEKDKQVLVSLLAAGHCPGSVMFLFEGDEGNVLYTGDFRFAKGEAARMEPLHSGSSVKDIKSVYVDTTFCVPEAMYIPSREQSKDVLLDLVEQHIQKSPTHMVRLACKAKYGYEYLFVEISKEFNLKVHVSPLVMAQYERVPALARHLTTDGSTTQVHACRYMDCAMNNATDVLVVVPSTMWFTGNAQPSDVLRKVGHRYRLCFSFHSSFSEVRDFLSYIRPVNIYPNVIPYRCTEEKINERLKDLKRCTKKFEVSETSSYKPLGKLKVSARTVRRNNAAPCKLGSDLTDELEVLFSETSPQSKRRKRTKIQEDQEVDDESDDDQQQRVLLDRESSSGHSYIAMDDSDLSSCELDLYDSASGIEQSQTHKEDGTQPNDTSSESGDFVKSTKLGLPLHQRAESSTSSRTLTVSSKLSEAEKKFGTDRKLSNIKSKHAEVSNWLRYLPNSSSVERQILGKRKESRNDALCVDGTLQRELNIADSSDRNNSLITQSDNPKRDKFRSKVRGHQSPNKKQTVESRKESQYEKQSVSSISHQDTKPDDISELNSSLAESDKTEEYKLSCSQELFMDGKLEDSPHEEVPIKSVKSDSRKCEGILDDEDHNEPKDKHKAHLGFQLYQTSSDSIRGKEASENEDLRWNDGSDKTQPFVHYDESPIKLPNRIKRLNHLQTSDLHQLTSKSKEPVFHNTMSEMQSFGGNSGHSQDTNHSEETFLPSSQGSLISQVSSDFDITCTPEGKKLHPSQVEEVKVMIARGDSIPLVSSNKTIISD